MPTPVPTTDWRKNAAREIATLLAGVVHTNNGDDASDGCFHGVTDADVAYIIKKHEIAGGGVIRGTGSGLALTEDTTPVSEEEPEVVIPPTLGIKPVPQTFPGAEVVARQILAVIKNQAARVADVALTLGKSREEIQAAINAPNSNLCIAKGGWIQEVLEG